MTQKQQWYMIFSILGVIVLGIGIYQYMQYYEAQMDYRYDQFTDYRGTYTGTWKISDYAFIEDGKALVVNWEVEDKEEAMKVEQ